MLWSFHCPFSVHLINVVASFSLYQKVTIFPQVREHSNHGALRKVQFVRDPANSGIRMLQKVKEDRRVIGEQSPNDGFSWSMPHEFFDHPTKPLFEKAHYRLYYDARILLPVLSCYIIK